MKYLIKKGKIILDLQNRMSCMGDKRIDIALKDEISSLKSYYLSISNINLSFGEMCHSSTSCCRYTRSSLARGKLPGRDIVGLAPIIFTI